jgi:hypothetical protein
MSFMQKISGKDGPPIYSPDMCLTMLIEGATLGVPEVDALAYQRLRTNVNRMIHQMAIGLPPEEKVALVKAVIQEFDTYRADTEAALRDALTGWRGLVAKLFSKLMTSLGIDAHNPDLFSLTQRIRHLSTSAELEAWDEKLTSFLDPRSGIAPADDAPARLRMADTSTANDNVAGLNGGGLALARLAELIGNADRGFVVIFRLGCLGLISERFGEEAMQDAVMAVSSYLTHSLHHDDSIYHWSDASLLAILGRRANEHILNAELKRIVALNRDININISGRVVMLRIPIEFETVPISAMRSADDVRKLSLEDTSAR